MSGRRSRPPSGPRRAADRRPRLRHRAREKRVIAPLAQATAPAGPQAGAGLRPPVTPRDATRHGVLGTLLLGPARGTLLPSTRRSCADASARRGALVVTVAHARSSVRR